MLAAIAAAQEAAPRVGGGDPGHDVVFVPGSAVRLIEVCAGHAGVTAAWRRAGELAAEPIELYEDVDRKLRPRPEMDITVPEVQARLLALARDAGGPNVWFLSPPCTSFSDWQLHNRGTRMFAHPTGVAPLTPAEVSGPTSTGRYPKLWDLPPCKKLAKRADCFLSTFHFCAWGLRAAGGAGFYPKRTTILVGRASAAAEGLRRSCLGRSARHVHVAIEGRRPGAACARSAEAGRYPDEFL